MNTGRVITLIVITQLLRRSSTRELRPRLLITSGYLVGLDKQPDKEPYLEPVTSASIKAYHPMSVVAHAHGAHEDHRVMPDKFHPFPRAACRV